MLGEGKDSPNLGKVGLRLGIGLDVPAESHTARERALLRATLPDVE